MQQASTVEYNKTPYYIIGVNHRESTLIGALALPEDRTLQKFIATEYGLKRVKSKVTSEIDELFRSLKTRTNSLYDSLNVNSTTIEAMFDNSSGLFEASPIINLTSNQELI